MAHTRITAIWTGATGLPGYTRMRFAGELDAAGAATAAGRMRTFFDAVKAYIPSVVSINFAEAAQVYNTARELQAEVGFTPPASVVGVGSGAFSAPAGMVVNWLTGAVVNGRKVRGRSFMVPLAGAAFATDGTPGPTTVTTFQGAAAALLTGTPALIIAGGTPETGSVEASVTGASVPDRAAVLRSRRD